MFLSKIIIIFYLKQISLNKKQQLLSSGIQPLQIEFKSAEKTDSKIKIKNFSA